MAKIAFAILWMMVWVTVAAAAALKLQLERRPGHQFFTGLPEYVQEDYLTFELNRGLYIHENSTENRQLSRNLDTKVVTDGLDIPEELVQQFEALEAPDNFTQNLFDFVQQDFELDQIGIRTLISHRSICFDDGSCISINDVGSVCCPF